MVTSPVGADYQYSNNGGAFYQVSPSFTVAASASYSITLQQISSGCISNAVTGTMAAQSVAGNILYVNAAASGNNDGTSWVNAYTKLQDALANTCPNVTQQVWVAKGVYFPDEGGGKTGNDRNASFVMKNNLGIYGGFAGTETLLSQRNWKNNVTTLSGDIGVTGDNSDNSFHVLANINNNLDQTAILDGFSIAGGNAENDGGGGMQLTFSSPQLTNCIFHDNQAGFDGGAISAGTGSNLSLAGISFISNTSLRQGGGIYSESDLVIKNSIFKTNSGGSGGGISCSAGLKITNAIFFQNRADSYGGAIDNKYGGDIELINTTFSNNIVSVPVYPHTQDIFIGTDAPIKVVNCILLGEQEIGSSANAAITYSIEKYQGTGNINADPLFVDAVNGNLHLQQGSLAINTGNNAANSESLDLDGNPRIVGVIDMGAYEQQQTCPSGNIQYVNASASGNNDGTSWANAFTKLQDALSGTCPAVTQIWVAKGTYYPDEGGGNTDNDRNASFVMKNNLAIYGGFAGTETQLSQRNWKTNQTILSGDIDQNDAGNFINNGNNSYHVVQNMQNGVDNTAIIDGFVITGGNANGQSANQPPLGGGMWNNSTSPTVTNCTFLGNSGITGGGMQNGGGSPSITNCVFQSNKGSAMYNSGASPTVTGCSFYNNFGSSGGGGIFNSTGASPIVTNCTFSGNTGGNTGSAMFNVDGIAPQVTNCIFWGDASEINVSPFSQASFTYCIIQGGFAGIGNIDADPLFVNAATGDLHLQSCSPAIDAGDDGANNLTTDLDGNNRKVDAIAGGVKIDRGAYEFQGTLPSATISGGTTVCLNAPSPNITFSASGGIAPYTFIFTLNNVSQTVTSSVNPITVAVPTNPGGQFNYSLVSVQDNSPGACPQAITNQTATVYVNPLPTANISGSTTVCKDGPVPVITFSGSGGTAPYTFSYTLPDGITSANVSGNPATINVATGTPGAYTYTLTGVQDASATGCSQLISGASAIVTINPSPDATITTGSPVTAVSPGNIASVPDAGTGASYSWSISNGTITAGTGTRSVTYKAGSSGSVQLNVSVTSGSNCGPATGSVTVLITALPCPNPAISVASSVCSSSTGNIASVISAGTGATYVWSITNGTITAGAGTRQISFTAASNKSADYSSDDYVKISVKVTNASGGCTESSGIYKVFISPVPSAAISTSSTVCSNSTNNFACVPFASTGATYQWIITNGSITTGAGTRSIWYNAGVTGSVTLALIVTNNKGCNASSGNKTIVIASLPVANITAATSVCAGSGGNIASVTSGSSGTKYCWSISNGCINSGSNSNSISYTAGSSGTVMLSVVVTNSSGCKTNSGNKLVTINVVPNATISASSPVCANSTGNTASVPAAGSGASYQWTISGGTINSGSGTNSVKYTAGTSGYTTLGVTVTNSNGCRKSSGKKITVTANAAPTFVQIGPLCKGSKAPSLPAKSTNGITGSWSPASISTASKKTTS
jgi:predicted outer membrane repeat protein